MGFDSGGSTVAAAVTVGSFAVMPLAGQIVLKSVKAGSVVVNGVRVTHGLTNKIRKLLTRRKFARYLTDIHKCENNQSEKEKLH